MDTQQIKLEVDKNLERLRTLRDEVKIQLHLASLDLKQEWDDKLSPKVFEAEQTAKEVTESSRLKVMELVAKVEDFVLRMREKAKR